MMGVFDYLKLPTEVNVEKNTPTYGRFSLEPLNEGYATTIGNALRRVLLSSIVGIAVVGVEIEGVEHEFSTIEGVKEDVLNIILNLKQVRFKALNDSFKEGEVYIHKEGPGSVVSGDIEALGNIEIVNKDIYIAELMDGAKLDAKIYLQRGIGYKQANYDAVNREIGFIPVDALFSPIVRVAYHTKKSTMKDYYDFEKLVLEIETDGTIMPQDALKQASYILGNYISIFSADFKETTQKEPEENKIDIQINENLLKPVEELELNVRASNCLAAHNIKYIYELTQKTDTELLNTKNFGKQSLKEIKDSLKQLGLELGMKFSQEQLERIQQLIEEKEGEDNEA
ncbi:DNA-directed RNA polymerase subunit alpha [Hippea maritima]|uniref:DNA-directed RNA polymerase subunit alpha n=1 Tax=Hippea maritima (strain ATCC 700847 / DSM 10411 / MH2) TaxID=760142 RepID=F2LXR4_HIPMA|nr:DNA-directed RNA polymerase subunit alpha [Hippea maritima]AEA34305.1 DNA-directed RNA polymerase subunit alpha [Hippea maritima DSM 10411]